MIALVIFLMLALLAIGGVAAYLYVRQKELERQAAQRPFGAGAARLLSGILAGVTGGQSALVTGALSAGRAGATS